MARVAECMCGHVLRGQDDDELFKQAREHADQAHKEMNISDDMIRQLLLSYAQDE